MGRNSFIPTHGKKLHSFGAMRGCPDVGTNLSGRPSVGRCPTCSTVAAAFHHQPVGLGQWFHNVAITMMPAGAFLGHVDLIVERASASMITPERK